MKLLNPGYESESVGGSLYWNKQKGSCYHRDLNETKECDFSSTGLSVDAQNMLASAVWYTGSNGSALQQDVIQTSRFYELERSQNTGKICSSGGFCNDSVTRYTKWTGLVGLMSPSDYGYAVGGDEALRTTCLTTALNKWNDSSVSSCKENDWLFRSGYNQWTINPKADTTSAVYEFRVTTDGHVVGTLEVMPYAILPSAYLKANIKIVSGTGSSTDPYKLAI